VVTPLGETHWLMYTNHNNMVLSKWVTLETLHTMQLAAQVSVRLSVHIQLFSDVISHAKQPGACSLVSLLAQLGACPPLDTTGCMFSGLTIRLGWQLDVLH
jgi:hypothetical protein